MPEPDNTIGGPDSLRRMDELAMRTMPSDPVKVQESFTGHEAEACPFRSHAFGVYMHGDPCRYAADVRERWRKDQEEGLLRTANQLGDRLRELNTKRDG